MPPKKKQKTSKEKEEKSKEKEEKSTGPPRVNRAEVLSQIAIHIPVVAVYPNLVEKMNPAVVHSLRLDTSTIPGAGNGLFVTRNITGGTTIGKYIGKRLSLKRHDELYPPGEWDGRYTASVRGGVLDSYELEDANLIRYINFADDSKANVRDAGEGLIVAKRDIAAGEELFWNYGSPNDPPFVSDNPDHVQPHRVRPRSWIEAQEAKQREALAPAATSRLLRKPAARTGDTTQQAQTDVVPASDAAPQTDVVPASDAAQRQRGFRMKIVDRKTQQDFARAAKKQQSEQKADDDVVDLTTASAMELAEDDNAAEDATHISHAVDDRWQGGTIIEGTIKEGEEASEEASASTTEVEEEGPAVPASPGSTRDTAIQIDDDGDEFETADEHEPNHSGQGMGLPPLHAHKITRVTQDPIGPSDHQTLLAPISVTSHMSLHGIKAVQGGGSWYNPLSWPEDIAYGVRNGVNRATTLWQDSVKPAIRQFLLAEFFRYFADTAVGLYIRDKPELQDNWITGLLRFAPTAIYHAYLLRNHNMIHKVMIAYMAGYTRYEQALGMSSGLIGKRADAFLGLNHLTMAGMPKALHQGLTSLAIGASGAVAGALYLNGRLRSRRLSSYEKGKMFLQDVEELVKIFSASPQSGGAWPDDVRQKIAGYYREVKAAESTYRKGHTGRGRKRGHEGGEGDEATETHT